MEGIWIKRRNNVASEADNKFWTWQWIGNQGDINKWIYLNNEMASFSILNSDSGISLSAYFAF